MTYTTKQYIDFDDLAGIVVTCGKCQTTLSLRLDIDQSQLPISCPSCMEAWYTMQPGSIGSDLTLFRSGLKQLKDKLGVKVNGLKFTMQIELKSAFPDVVASSRNHA